jgi:hypothetical protein
MSPTFVTTVDNLPAHWVNPPGPRRETLEEIRLVFDSHRLPAFHVSFAPRPGCTTVQVVVDVGDDAEAQLEFVMQPPPILMIGAIEVLSAAEVARAIQEESIRNGQIATLTGYITGDGTVPLLTPGQDAYRLTLTYDVDLKQEDGTTTTEAGVKQSFAFATDERAPDRLDPWILGTTPDHEERFHFYEDPVRIIFNDLQVVQLFDTYGKRLRISVHAADGVPVPEDEIIALEPVVGEIGTPYLDTLRDLFDDLLPCLDQLTVTIPPHGSKTVAIPLRPLMAYTLDVLVDPPNEPPANGAPTPLYRRSFATSRFANLASFIADIRARPVRHRALVAPVQGLPTDGVAPDLDIQTALQTAGEQALPAPEKAGITIYWVRPETSDRFVPHAILIDAAEPIWRTRQQAQVETVEDQDDDQYRIVVPAEVTALEMVEQNGAHIIGFVRSPSGTRTLAMLSESFTPPASVTLALHQTAGSLYGIDEVTQVLLELAFEERAPWEEVIE